MVRCNVHAFQKNNIARVITEGDGGISITLFFPPNYILKCTHFPLAFCSFFVYTLFIHQMSNLFECILYNNVKYSHFVKICSLPFSGF